MNYRINNFCFSWFWNWAKTLKMISEWAMNFKNEIRLFSSVHNKNEKIDQGFHLVWNRKKRRNCLIYFRKTNLLKKIKEQLPDDFIRTHRSFLVSKDKVDRIIENTIVIRNYEIPISIRLKKSVLDRCRAFFSKP